ncbi:ATPase [Clostridiaceae bacterium]|jgi:type IV secretion system protein VirD4|nr:ATPase [Clostridiaceae bacterium]RKJ82975.1 ATPase [Butyricicoccus sp. 1XD8-22]
MKRPSELLALLESRVIKRFGRWYDQNRAKLPTYIVLGVVGWYFYGMFINSIRLGIQTTFSMEGNAPPTIWVANPILNFIAVFSPTGLATTAVSVLLICLITKKGYNIFSGYKAVQDKRGFDILPEGTHGTATFMTKKEMGALLEIGAAADLQGTIYGKHKMKETDDDKYADYIASRSRGGFNDNILIIGAPGTGKSRGFVKPFILQCVKRRESLVVTDPKSELFESMSGYLTDAGYEVRVFNLLDMEFSDCWNCLGDADHDPTLVQSISNTIITNTSNEKEAGDFWSKAELNLLTALLFYVQNLSDSRGNLLPIEERSLSVVFQLLSTQSIDVLDGLLRQLPISHPARAPFGLFLQAKENVRGNVAIGLGNRLSVFQHEKVQRITSGNTIDLTLPGQKPCAYFCILSAQDSTYAFLSSLFFTMLFARLEDFARRHGDRGRLPVPVNFCLDEFCNIGKLNDFKRTLSVVRGYQMNCQLIVQSIAQLADFYPRHEWEELAGNCDTTIFLGCNDQMTADFVSKKCGMTTIRVTNNQMPLMPLFSPIYTSTRPYSQTRSNVQRALKLPDEVLRQDPKQVLVMMRGEKTMELYKITPEELPENEKMRPVVISNYQPVQDMATPQASAPEPSWTPLAAAPLNETPNPPACDIMDAFAMQTISTSDAEEDELDEFLNGFQPIDRT